MDDVKCVLLDIEGTICPISFVKDTLVSDLPAHQPPQFPYALNALPNILATKWDNDEFKPYREAFPESAQASPEDFRNHVEDLTSRDVKIAYLKNLQGYLWETGFKTGAYAAPLFSDVTPQLRRWKQDGIKLAIYSSGSVFAQKLLFGHVASQHQSPALKRKRHDQADSKPVNDGEESAAKRTNVSAHSIATNENHEAVPPDTLKTSIESYNRATEQPTEPTEDIQSLISGWFDTTNAGLKQESQSYVTIARALEIKPEHFVFLSDNVKEVDAAVAGGMISILVDRPGNAPLADADRKRLRVVYSLDEVSIGREWNSRGQDSQVPEHVGRRRSQRLKSAQS